MSPLSSLCFSTEAVAKVLLVTEYIFKCPLNIRTDKGTQFESNLFNELSKLLGSRHSTVFIHWSSIRR